MSSLDKKPVVFVVGGTQIDWNGLGEYLEYTGNMEFWETAVAARATGLHDVEILDSTYAKLCYKSLSLGQNANVTKIRDIPENIVSVLRSKHGSVLEHGSLNMIVTDCSRIYTHEQVRHRPGMAYSQTSGRFVRLNEIDVVFDPLLEPIRESAVEFLKILEGYYERWAEILGLDKEKSFEKKKKITSALRRFAPNGQTNEIGVTMNLRAARHQLQLRTAPSAEWEIRLVFNQIFKKLTERFTHLFADAVVLKDEDPASELFSVSFEYGAH